MNTPTLTILAPAIMAFLFYAGNVFFPPSRANGGFFSKAPEWWARDQKTWDTAFNLLAKKYLLYAIIIAVFCGAMLFFDWEYAGLVGYILLPIFLLLANYQVRAYMQDKVK